MGTHHASITRISGAVRPNGEMVACGYSPAPFEVRRLAGTLSHWFWPIVAWQAKVSNDFAEGMNNDIEASQTRCHRLHQLRELRALLYAGKPNFRALDSIVVA